MSQIFLSCLSWLGFSTTLFSMWLAGKRSASGWIIGTLSEAFWIPWSILTGSWAVLALSVCLGSIYVVNAIKWLRPEWRVKV